MELPACPYQYRNPHWKEVCTACCPACPCGDLLFCELCPEGWR
jgi:hypothetical protein